jgi:hypothetical protein
MVMNMEVFIDNNKNTYIVFFNILFIYSIIFTSLNIIYLIHL